MELRLDETPVPGLVVVHLPVHEDSRGWFKENWQREKMTALGVPDFGPVQNNMSFNARRGTTRGVHAEPWDKFVSVASGRVFAAWVDLREGPSFGRTFHCELGPDTAVFVPRGIGNSYQALEDGTVYSYLVNDHWRPDQPYPALHLGDPDAGIPWPIPLDEADISEKDRTNPLLTEVTPMRPRRTLIVGAHGQLGRGLRAEFPQADCADREELDITDPAALASWPWHEYGLVLNAAGYTAVDEAESDAGRVLAWAINAHAPAQLALLARQHRFTLVHYSSDYVFDGTASEHAESEGLSPLGVYGQSKAAGDLAVASVAAHYVIRTSWVVGEGRNFVRTMASLARAGVSPSVVCDQVGRLTFTTELSRATRHLVETGAPYGTYNCTNSGPPMSWAEIARAVFRLCGRDGADVGEVTSAEYAAGKALARRPGCSVLSLDRLRDTGFSSTEATAALADYLEHAATG
nr:bifunctional dTDP-4-dehydrorhamnose 3,5-epimerase family protein/NAD(P)-dependent oxidoreductase [Nocardioides euryhalodurans]